jgi:hypothetical protein
MLTLAKDWVIVHSEPQFPFLISILTGDWNQQEAILLLKSISEKQNWTQNIEDSIMFFHNYSTHCKANRDIQSKFNLGKSNLTYFESSFVVFSFYLCRSVGRSVRKLGRETEESDVVVAVSDERSEECIGPVRLRNGSECPA